MGVIELNRPVLREIRHGDLALLQVAQHVLKRAAHKEVLLLEAQAAAFIGAVVGIENFGEGFGANLFLNSAVVVADVEGVEVKGFGGCGTPKPEPIAGVDLVAQHRDVVRNADGVLGGNPAGAVAAVLIGVALGAAAKAHKHRLIRVGELPGPTAFEPLIGDLHLPAVANQLIENSKLVADAVANRWHFQAGQRFHVASGQASQTAITKARLFFHLADVVQRGAVKALQGFSSFFLDAQHQEVVAQLWTDQEFR